ncbi:hypothetical protein C8J56DRAFT_150856 [Mycena floridula]|nr:hypothetical protein C8J56DRAFT_150856 [Mycena floridula]
MRLLFLLCVLLFSRSLFAATVTSLFPSSSAFDSSSTLSTATTATKRLSTVHRPVFTKPPASPHIIHNNPPPSTHSFSRPAASGAPAGFPQHHHRERQKPLVTILEIIGGAIAFLLLIGLVRCIISYKKTPNRDRIAAIMHRHQLQRELEELAQAQPLHRSSLVEPPPPPYLPRPPSYSDDQVSMPLNSTYDSSSPPATPPAARHRVHTNLPDG